MMMPAQPEPERPQPVYRYTAPKPEPEPETLVWDPVGDPTDTTAGSISGPVPRVGFSTVIGPAPALDRLLEQWQRMSGQFLFDVQDPVVLPVPPDAGGTVLRVAMVRHEEEASPRVVDALRTSLPRYGLPELTAEEGYFYEPAGLADRLSGAAKAAQASAEAAEAARAGAGGGASHRPRPPWTVTWTTDAVPFLRPIDVPVPAAAYGARWRDAWAFPPRTVLIDTGDEGAAGQTGFEEYAVASEQPRDAHGHGTTIGALIRAVQPLLRVHCYRVMGAHDRYVESALLLNALSVAVMSPDLWDVVCVPQRAVISTPSQGQQSAIELILATAASRGQRMPVVVCAAGNAAPAAMAYPATVPGVVVATALDQHGSPAPYNCPPPAGAQPYTVAAFGGVADHPLAYVKPGAGASWPLYGSSCAAGIVAASLAASAERLTW